MWYYKDLRGKARLDRGLVGVLQSHDDYKFAIQFPGGGRIQMLLLDLILKELFYRRERIKPGFGQCDVKFTRVAITATPCLTFDFANLKVSFHINQKRRDFNVALDVSRHTHKGRFYD